jgi:hypothetical protein
MPLIFPQARGNGASGVDGASGRTGPIAAGMIVTRHPIRRRSAYMRADFRRFCGYRAAREAA